MSINVLTELDLNFPLEVTAIYVDCDVDSNKMEVENVVDLLSITNICDYNFIIRDPVYGDLDIKYSEENGRYFQQIKKVSKVEFMG